MRFSQHIKIIKKIHYIFIFLLLFFIVFIFYGNILKTWFQQDEWYLLGKYTYLNSSRSIPILGAFLWNLFPDPRFSFSPLSDATFALLVKFWGINFSPYAIFSLLLHATNSFLVFLFVRKLTKNIGISWLTSIIFTTSSIGQNAIIWIAASVNTQGAAALSLATLLIFHKFIETRKKKWFFLVFPTLLAALWFKETSMPIFLIIIAFSLFFAGSWKKNKSFHIIIISSLTIFFILYFITRILLSMYGATMHQDYVKLPRLLTPKEYAEVVLWSPARTLVDNFVSPNTIYWLAKIVTTPFLSYLKLTPLTTTHDLFIENQATNLTTIFIFIVILIIFVKAYRNISTNQLRASFVLGIIIMLSSALVNFMLSIRGTSALNPIFRSRDMYFSVAGASLCLAIILGVVSEKLQKLRFNTKNFILLFVVIYGIYHLININQFVLRKEEEKARLRKTVVNTIYDSYPLLPRKVIFYTESDTPFYGSALPSMPFQTGFGRTLLVWYSLKNNDRPIEFLKDDFLYLPHSQGYKEIKGSGFGYFTDLDKLIKTINEFKVEANDIIAFSYEGKTKKLTDITSLIKEKLK